MRKGGHVADQLIGYGVSVIVMVGIGWGLARWFAWRSSLRRRLVENAGDAAMFQLEWVANET
jgi:hypothetical protein